MRLLRYCCTFKIRKKLPFLAICLLLGAFILLLAQTLNNKAETSINTLHQPLVPFFKQRHEVSCKALFDNDRSEMAMAAKVSTTVEKDYELWLLFSDCNNVRKRFFYAESPMSEQEASFPLAFTILANDDLVQVEQLLSAVYTPQNSYCFHIDIKSSQIFSNGVRRYAKCFPNVVVSDEQYPVSSSGINMIRAIRGCFHALASVSSTWKYMFTLQGKDFPLRTNAELVSIANILNGANDVEMVHAGTTRLQKRYIFSYGNDGVPIGLNTGTNVTASPPPINEFDKLTIYKGSVAVTLSRAFVQFILDEPKAVNFVKYLDNAIYTDELYFSTLNHNDVILPAPGGYPGRCSSVGRKDWLTRYVVWKGYKNASCSGIWRHSVCVFGTGDLPKLITRPELFVNKLWTRQFPLTTSCLHELLFNRTHFPGKYPSLQYGFNRTWYENSAPVVYQNWKLANPDLPSSKFTCKACLFNCEH